LEVVGDFFLHFGGKVSEVILAGVEDVDEFGGLVAVLLGYLGDFFAVGGF
jgi:hypothetical protein